MTSAASTPQHLPIEIELIDDPDLPSRSAMDDDKLDALAASIRAVGLIEPLVLERTGDRFKVLAGHRRRIACQRAGLRTVSCMVHDAGHADALTIQAHENSRREELSSTDEALWFAQLLEQKCGGDIEQLAGLVGEKVSYIDGRLALLRGDTRVFEALARGGIKIGIAHELNKVDDTRMRNYFLQIAERDGVTLSALSGWVLDWRRNTLPPAESSAPGEPAAPGIAAELRDPFCCKVCGKSNNVHLMRQINVHVHCEMAILDPLLGTVPSDS